MIFLTYASLQELKKQFICEINSQQKHFDLHWEDVCKSSPPVTTPQVEENYHFEVCLTKKITQTNTSSLASPKWQGNAH